MPARKYAASTKARSRYAAGTQKVRSRYAAGTQQVRSKNVRTRTLVETRDGSNGEKTRSERASSH